MGIFTETLIPFGEKYIKPIGEDAFKFLKGGIESGGEIAVKTVKSPLFRKSAVITGSGLLLGAGAYEGSKLLGKGAVNISKGLNVSASNLGFKMPQPKDYETAKGNAPTQTTPNKSTSNAPNGVSVGTNPTNKPITINMVTPTSTKETGYSGFFNMNNILMLGALGGGIYLIGKYISKRK